MGCQRQTEDEATPGPQDSGVRCIFLTRVMIPHLIYARAVAPDLGARAPTMDDYGGDQSLIIIAHLSIIRIGRGRNDRLRRAGGAVGPMTQAKREQQASSAVGPRRAPRSFSLRGRWWSDGLVRAACEFHLGNGDGYNVTVTIVSVSVRGAGHLLRCTLACMVIALVLGACGSDETSSPGPTGVRPQESEELAFVSDRDGDFEVYVMNLDGSNLRKLTDNSAFDSEPAWSPDGERLAFVTDRDGNFEIYVMNADGTDETRLTENDGADFGPAWSPDRGSIAYYSQTAARNFDLYVMSPHGTERQRLTNSPAHETDPTWSPDGEKIAFLDRLVVNGHPAQLRVLDLQSLEVTSLSQNDEGSDQLPAWSPDGTSIVFASDRDGDNEVYVIEADGSGLVGLTEDPANDSAPAWSPDGERLAFVTDRDGNFEIYLMNADGSALQRITVDQAADGLPTWRPRR